MRYGSKSRSLPLLRLTAAACVAVLSSSTIEPSLAQDSLRVVPDEYVVTVRRNPGSRASFAASASPSFASSVATVKGVINREALVVTAPRVAKEAAQAASASPDGSRAYDPQFDRCKEILAEGRAASCSPNWIVRASDIPNDPRYSELWGLGETRGIDAPRAWDLFTGSTSIVVAVIDTGIDYTHPDLSANMWRNPGETAGNGVDDDGNGFIDDLHGINARTGAASPGNPMDDHYHGTHVAGTIGAVGNNNLGVVGVNHRVKLMALKFLSASGSGSLSDAIRAIDYMTMMRSEHGINVRVSNNSWGGGGYSAALESAITRARDAGIIFVAAAGNASLDNDSSPSYPANYEVSNVVSVAAIDREQNLASFSNYGATSVDIAAPGVGILSCVPGSGYNLLSGTSMATPHVAGALALLLGNEPGLSFTQAINRLYLSGTARASLVDPASGSPLVATQRALNVGRMLHNETAPLPTPPSDQVPCGYGLQASNLLSGGSIDTAADTAPIVIQADESNFYQVDLPFAFPFFRESISRIWLSPNGVVYTRAPQALDYVIGAKAPKNSIAALQTDLIPRASDQGVRVAVASDRVTIHWSGEHYSFPGQGVITVRLTIYSDGRFVSSVHFGSDGLAVNLKAFVLGNPFAASPTSPLSLVGAAGTLGVFSSVLGLAETQMSLTSSSSDPLALGVEMANQCSPANPPQDGDPSPEVTAITITKTGGGRLSVPVNIAFQGQGSGNVPLSIRINGRGCRGSASVDLSSGSANLRARIPTGVTLMSASSGAAQDSARFRWARTTGPRPPNTALCSRVLRTLTPQ